MCFFNVEGSVDEWERSVAVVDNRRHEFFGTTRVPLAVFFVEGHNATPLNYKSRARDRFDKKKQRAHATENKMAAV